MMYVFIYKQDAIKFESITVAVRENNIITTIITNN